MAVSEDLVRPLTIAPPSTKADLQWLEALWQSDWGGTTMVTRGVVHRLAEAISLIARRGTRSVGAVSFVYDRGAERCEILSLNATERGRGVGTALLAAAEGAARANGCPRTWLVTSNDNLDALRFYQRRGYRIAAVHVGAVDAARQMKPTIPLIGHHGVLVHDEIELEKRS